MVLNWISENSTLVVGLLMILSTALGYFGNRLITRQAHVEDQESLERTIRIKSLMEAEKLSLEEVKKLRDQFRSGGANLISTEARAIVDKKVEAEKAKAKLFDNTQN